MERQLPESTQGTAVVATNDRRAFFRAEGSTLSSAKLCLPVIHLKLAVTPKAPHAVTYARKTNRPSISATAHFGDRPGAATTPPIIPEKDPTLCPTASLGDLYLQHATCSPPPRGKDSTSPLSPPSQAQLCRRPMSPLPAPFVVAPSIPYRAPDPSSYLSSQRPSQRPWLPSPPFWLQSWPPERQSTPSYLLQALDRSPHEEARPLVRSQPLVLSEGNKEDVEGFTHRVERNSQSSQKESGNTNDSGEQKTTLRSSRIKRAQKSDLD